MPAKTVLITGVTRGCGLALANAFARRGHTVIGCGRSAAEIDHLQQSHPAPHSFAVLDVAADDQVAKWSRTVLSTHPAPDLILNNAALINQNAPLWRVPAAEFAALVDVNLKGPANVIRHFLPAMLARGRGVVVNFSSGWGRSTAAEVAPYCATKWGIEGLTRALAQELPPGLAAIPLNPGIINTAMLQSCFGGGAEAYPTPEVWAEIAVPFLLKLGPADNGQPRTVPSPGAND